MSDIVRLEVQGMTCDHCQSTVSEALARAGLEEARADWRRGVARGRPTESFTEDRAAAELEAVGYRLGGVESPAPAPDTDRGDAVYDLAIIGAGSAAFAAAIKASELGGRVVIIERETMGGTCVKHRVRPLQGVAARRRPLPPGRPLSLRRIGDRCRAGQPARLGGTEGPAGGDDAAGQV